MADGVQALTKAFSGLHRQIVDSYISCESILILLWFQNNEGLGGLGVDESTMVTALANWRKQPEKRSGFRKSFPGLFKDHGVIERCEDDYILHLTAEFSRFKNLMVLWAMHPWERDARLAHHVLHQAHPAAIIVEIACTRSAEELLGARKAYMALFHHSLEEDVAYRARDKPYCSVS
jgi:annexin A13